MKITIECEGIGLDISQAVRKCAKCGDRLENGKNVVALKSKSMCATTAFVHIQCFENWAKEVRTFIE